MRSVPNPPDAVAFPRTNRTSCACSTGAPRSAPRRSPRRRLFGREGHRAAGHRRQGRHHLDPAHGQGAGSRSGEPGGAHPGRHLWAGDRGPVARHAVHHAPLHAGLSLLDARRLDRHALGRPLRHALHAHRRFRRKHARGDAGRHTQKRAGCRVPAPPSPDRLFIGSGRHPGHHHRSVGALRKKPTFRASASVRFKDFFAGADAVRDITQAGLYPANCRLLEAREALPGIPWSSEGGGAGAGLRIGRSPARRLDEARAEICARTAASPMPAPTTRTPIAPVPPAPGATASSARRTTASMRWHAASCPRPSRPR